MTTASVFNEGRGYERCLKGTIAHSQGRETLGIGARIMESPGDGRYLLMA